MALQAWASDPVLTWSFDQPTYASPGSIVAQCTVQAPPDVELLSLIWRPNVPTNWLVSATWGDGAPEFDSGSNLIVFTGMPLATNGTVAFSYLVEVPAGDTNAWTVQPEAEFHLDGEINPRTLLADPITIKAVRVITASAGAHGSIAPASTNVSLGDSPVFAITADPYYHVADIATNGVSVGGTFGMAVTNFTWGNVMSDGTISASFAANLVASLVPEWWLAQYGWTNNFEAAVTNDADGDGMTTGDEYIAGTDPTDPASILKLSGCTINYGTNYTEQIWTNTWTWHSNVYVHVHTQRVYEVLSKTWQFPAAPGHSYDIEGAGGSLQGNPAWAPLANATNLTGSPYIVVTNLFSFTTNSVQFFRVRARLQP